MPSKGFINKKGDRNPGSDVSKVLASGSGKIKKKIRDIHRLLQRPTLPADVRVNNERTLKALEVQLNNVVQKSNEKKNAKKYHMVRFFERKKATRLVKQARIALSAAEESNDRKAAKKARVFLKHKEIDLVYTVLFPKMEKYISLYPNSKNEDESSLPPKALEGMKRADQRRIEFRKHIEKLMKEEKLPFSLEDVLKGKKFEADQGTAVTDKQEIDAPQKKSQGSEVDEFFEDGSD
ncbi:18S rRNA maturation protein [Yamadazyma tenuis]|uniref:rRNA-processing protein EFG1 n=1 Tax=Candida tenuis (strain ATCC 10573 / BCRC 21748 / CBS 615 / JCM 9827 / NBRC 10315 / NRRL Y-1498 / VKM Y-70) TaxID=590646 RepID=G3B4H3_CANTC|nr:rRNA-processing protein EFG1 [Yamadazyma tenuis ATCC 10573]EGV63828.1 rRNA-processing protein EFG1 [Yamadazyma tenuis ATCC 10573]WEJ96563.1 18S rRNA maturation protein [Yamadazyma tenuis]